MMTDGQRRTRYWIARTVVGGGGLALSGPLVAAEPGAPLAALGAGGYLAQLVGSLGLVILAILLLAWLLRRLPTGGSGPGQAIEILAARAIGTRERLLLVRVGEEQILVGVTPAGMHRLHRLRQPLTVAPPEPPPDFGSLLRRALGGGGRQA